MWCPNLSDVLSGLIAQPHHSFVQKQCVNTVSFLRQKLSVTKPTTKLLGLKTGISEFHLEFFTLLVRPDSEEGHLSIAKLNKYCSARP